MSTALLILDLQQALCTGMEAAVGISRVIDRINGLSRRARAAGAPVIHIQHEEPGGPLLADSPGWQLATGLETEPSDLRVRKTTPNAFHQTDLAAALHARGITRVVVCGLQTECCIDTTVRQALPLGFAVALASDAHSTVDGVITAAQAIAHHNRTLGFLEAFGPRIEIAPAATISFSA
jgi:nicotinamidase-related amidase